MHDIKAIRENPENYDTLWTRRGLEPQTPVILELDGRLRRAVATQQQAGATRNRSSRLIGRAMIEGDLDRAERLKTEVADARKIIEAAGKEVEKYRSSLNDLLSRLPNLPFEDVPEGTDEGANVELHKWGTPREFSFEVRDHADLGEALGMMDFETAAKMSGARFVILSGLLSRLDRAIAAFMLDLQTGEHGYTETTPPVLVRDTALYGTGQLPKFEEESYQTTAGHYLIPTSEVSLTNIVRDSIINAGYLPRRYAAHTSCFRSEAGAAGKDTRGMIRQHQFSKVELVSIVRPEHSGAEHTRMLGCAEEVLKRLELPYRVVELCTGDLGFGARRTFDIEVWLPSQDKYREISSCSNCGDFQARRMNARYKHADRDNRFVHTLNGSGLAVGRTLVAILENCQNEDGSVTVPEALVPYMGGVGVIK